MKGVSLDCVTVRAVGIVVNQVIARLVSRGALLRFDSTGFIGSLSAQTAEAFSYTPGLI